MQTPEQERELNAAFARVFAGAQGKLVLDYLKGKFVNAILGSEVSDAALRYREGGRFVVALIESRVEMGRRNSVGATARKRTAERPAAGQPGSGRQPPAPAASE